MNGIENITNRIADEAEKTAREIITAAEAEARAMREEYARKGEGIKEKRLARGRAAAAGIASRRSGAAELEAKRAALSKKQELISRAFDEAAKKLSALSGDERADVLARLALRAADGGSGEIILSEAERKELGRKVLKKCAENKNIALSDETREIGGGLILKDGAAEVNCTFSALVAELRESLSREVADVLFG